jgi:hypothetical protein
MFEQVLISLYLNNKKKEGYENIEHLTPAENAQISRFLFYARIISFAISLYAAYLFYNCSTKSEPISRILGVLLSFAFGTIYLIYYFIRFLMGRKCN